MPVCDNLFMLRSISKMTQQEVADKIGVTRQAYARWEKGDTLPDIEKSKQLADLFGISIESLLVTESIRGVGVPQTGPRGKNIWGTATVGEHGQILIPKEAREKFGLTYGCQVVILSDDSEGLALVPVEMFEKRLKYLLSVVESETQGQK